MTRMQMEPVEREPAWLSHAADQRVTFFRNMASNIVNMKPGAIMMMLTEPPEWANAAYREKFDHSCDRCNTEADFYGNVEREAFGTKVVITFAACDECLELA